MKKTYGDTLYIVMLGMIVISLGVEVLILICFRGQEKNSRKFVKNFENVFILAKDGLRDIFWVENRLMSRRIIDEKHYC